MKDIVVLLFSGSALWVAGTIYYAHRGVNIFETTPLRYWTGFFVSPIITACACVLIVWLRQVSPASWASAMLLIALPGMAGEALVLANFSIFMPKFHEASEGRYGAFLFATYAVVLGAAEIVTLRAKP